MAPQVFWVAALCTKDQRLVTNVITLRRSTRHTLRLCTPEATPPADIAVVDSHDPQMRAALATLQRRNPQLVTVWLVLDGGRARRGAQEFELPYVNIVAHLIPVLEMAAADVLAARSVQAAAAPALPPAATPASATVLKLVAEPRAARLHALVVDDSPTVRLQLRQILLRMGLSCDCAADGHSALEHLAGAQHYDLIYVDVVLPDTDGYRLTRDIRRLARHAQTPLIVLTSQSSPFDRARAALAGSDSFLSKPVELRRFFEVTARQLRKGLAVSDLQGWLIDPTQEAGSAATGAHAPSGFGPTVPQWPPRQRSR